jgi:beta-galactosidase
LTRFLICLSAVALLAANVHAQTTAPSTIDLSGQWRFAVDPKDTGTAAQWFNQNLPDKIILPGILQAQGYGDEISTSTPWVAALPRDMRWYLLPQYKAYTQPGNVKMPYLSQPPRHYLGVAWYQRDIDIPAQSQGRRFVLTLERTRWQSTVWIDARNVGSYRSFVAPHIFDLGSLTPGTHRLTIRIDNDTRKIQPPYRPDGHSVSDSEGATWNGIVGRIELASTSQIWIDDAQAFPDIAAKTVRIKVTIGNATGKVGTGTLAVGSATTQASWDADGASAELTAQLPADTQTWNEFNPVLQHLTVKLTGPGIADQRDISFGLRQITVDGKRMLFNGTPLEIRATHDGGGFPLTGYPAMDVDSWKHIISTCKQWGLNGMRFHSWCPPEAAFQAADELGFYFQPECGMWNSFDTGGAMLKVLNQETERMVRAYGNHPSFLLLAPTNEPAGHYQEQLPTWVNKWRAADPRRLYTTGTGRPSIPSTGADKGNDFLIFGARGPRGWFGRDYNAALRALPVPALAHELGQWCAYPDFSVISKFTGYLQPSNYEIARDSAAAHGLLEKNHDLALASGRFQVECYKEEIEANQRTNGYSGFELLDLHDYLGQGTAFIGVLDAFWESKGYVTPDEWTRFCNSTVLLARLSSRVFTTAQTLTAEVEIAHYDPTPLNDAVAQWRIVDSTGAVVVSGQLPSKTFPIGKGTSLGTISVDLSKLPAPRQYKLIVSIAGNKFKNDWNFWLYPAVVDGSTPADVVVTTSWPKAQSALAAGSKVLFTPEAADLDEANPRLTATPIFWNRLMNPNGTAFLGLWCDTASRALAGFPTETNCDWQWTDLFPGSRAINLDNLPRGLQPIVQGIDDWNRNFKLGAIYECRVGTGKLMVCSLNLSSDRPGAASLRRSLLDYMTSDRFQPSTEVPAADLANQWLSTRAKSFVSEANQARPNQQQSPDVQAPQPVTPTSRPH